VADLVWQAGMSVTTTAATVVSLKPADTKIV